ncbi:MAG: glycosyltransferase family 39 protein [bacterium]|nr:glycosyltransferase family 39 protein [bacterium]
MRDKIKINNWVILVIIVLIGSILRLYQLGTESIWLDESVGIQNVYTSFTAMIRNVISNDISPPLYFTLLWGWIKLFGRSEIAVRLLSAILGITSILLMYKLGKLLFSRKEALVGAFIFAISKPPIWASQEARMYPLFIFLVLASSILFIKFCTTNSKKTLFLLTFVNILISYTHLYGLFFILFEGIYILAAKREKLKDFIISGIIIIICYIPWIIVLKTQIPMGAGSWIGRVGGLSGIYYIIWKLSSEYKLLVLAFGTLAMFGVIREFKEHNRSNVLLLLLWILTPIVIAYTLSYLIRPFLDARYVFFVVPAYYLLVARGIFWLKNKVAQSLSLLVITGISGYILFSYYTTIQKEQWRESVKFVETSELKADGIVITGGSTAFEYYYNGSLPAECLPFAFPMAQGTIITDSIKNRIDNMQNIWFFKSAYNNPKLGFEEWLNGKFCIKTEKDFFGIKVYYCEKKE